jgi:outer membrane protein assembly factor BamB
MCFDKRNRKVFVGDQKGRIYCINIKNGAKMKKFKKPDRGGKSSRDKEDISSLVYWSSRATYESSKQKW